ncbi:MAG: hypothetical protein V2A54_14150 [Bacteroidota bacterium]
MKRFLLVTLLITIGTFLLYFFVGECFKVSQGGIFYPFNFEYEFLEFNRSAAFYAALINATVLMTVNIIYEMFIIPKKRQKKENIKN